MCFFYFLFYLTRSDLKSYLLICFIINGVAYDGVIWFDYLVPVSGILGTCLNISLVYRAPTLYGVPRDETLRMGHAKTCSELKNIFAALVKQSNPPEPCSDTFELPGDILVPEVSKEVNTYPQNHDQTIGATCTTPTGSATMDAYRTADSLSHIPVLHHGEDGPITISKVPTLSESNDMKQVTDILCDNSIVPEASREADTSFDIHPQRESGIDLGHDSAVIAEVPKEADNTVYRSREPKKPKLKIRVKHSAASSRAEEPDNGRQIRSQDGGADADHGASSSVSVDAPQRNFIENISTSNQNLDDVNSSHDVGSRVTASIGSAKLATELQCTADSSKVSLPLLPDDHLPSSTMKNDLEMPSHGNTNLPPLATNIIHSSSREKDKVKNEKKKKKKKEKRKRNDNDGDPEHLERKRLKKEKKRKEKEMAKILYGETKTVDSVGLRINEGGGAPFNGEAKQPSPLKLGDNKNSSRSRTEMAEDPATKTKPSEASASAYVNTTEDSAGARQPSTGHKIKIKFKNRMLGKP